MPDTFNILDYGDLAWLTADMIDGEFTFNRRDNNNSSLSMTSQSLRIGYFTARRARTVSQVKISSTGTAAGATPSLVRVGLWTADAAGALVALVASTANDTALLATMNTDYAKALSASYTFIPGQRYAGGLLVVTAAAAPTTIGWNAPTTVSAHSPKMSGLIAGSSDLPASAAAGGVADNGNAPYIEFLA